MATKQKPIITLTQVQEDAIAYWLSRTSRPNDHRTPRKACRMVREYCEAHEYSAEDTERCVQDMIDMYKLERVAE